MGGAPVQTPCTFVKGGGAAKFSEDCENALLACGYDPDAFGSYSHTQNQIKAARARVDAYNAAVAEGRDAGPPPLPSDYHMANCEAGHVSQDATHRAAGSRNDICGNLYDGYDTNLAPCMPQSRSASTPGSEHNAASRHEMASAVAGRAAPPNPGGSTYDTNLRDVHERDRIEQVVNTSDPNAPREPISREEWERRRNQSASAGGDVPGAQAPASAGGVAPDGATSSAMPASDEAKQKAAECIDAFRKAGLAHMKQEAQTARGEGAEAARAEYDAAGGPTTERELERRRDEAQQGLNDLRSDRDQAQRREASRTGHARTQTALADSESGTDANRERSVRNAEGAQDAQRTRENANMLISNQERVVADAENDLAAHQRLRCAAEEGERINDGQARPETARAPSLAHPWAGSDFSAADATQTSQGLPGLPAGD